MLSIDFWLGECMRKITQFAKKLLTFVSSACTLHSDLLLLDRIVKGVSSMKRAFVHTAYTASVVRGTHPSNRTR